MQVSLVLFVTDDSTKLLMDMINSKKKKNSNEQTIVK